MSTPKPGTNVPQIPTLSRRIGVVPFSSLKAGDTFRIHESSDSNWIGISPNQVWTKTPLTHDKDNGLPQNALCDGTCAYIADNAPVVPGWTVKEDLPLWLIEGSSPSVLSDAPGEDTPAWTVCPSCGCTGVYGNGVDATELACPNCGLQYNPNDYAEFIDEGVSLPPSDDDPAIVTRLLNRISGYKPTDGDDQVDAPFCAKCGLPVYDLTNALCPDCGLYFCSDCAKGGHYVPGHITTNSIQFKDIAVGELFTLQGGDGAVWQRVMATAPKSDHATFYYFRANARLYRPPFPGAFVVEYIHLLDASLVERVTLPSDRIELTPAGFRLVSEAEQKKEIAPPLPGLEVSPASYYDEV